MRYLRFCPSFASTISSRLPRLIFLEKVTTPSISLTTAGITGVTGFEKLRYPGQTTGNIRDLTELAGNLNDLLAYDYLGTVFDADISAYGEVVTA